MSKLTTTSRMLKFRQKNKDLHLQYKTLIHSYWDESSLKEFVDKVLAEAVILIEQKHTEEALAYWVWYSLHPRLSKELLVLVSHHKSWTEVGVYSSKHLL